MPIYPKANVEVERTVQTAKNILRKKGNPHLGLLAYRTAPLRDGLTLCEIIMSRRLWTRLHAIPEVLEPTEIERNEIEKKEEVYREKHARNYNSYHQVVSLRALEGGNVYIQDHKKFGEVEWRYPSITISNS